MFHDTPLQYRLSMKRVYNGKEQRILDTVSHDPSLATMYLRVSALFKSVDLRPYLHVFSTSRDGELTALRLLASCNASSVTR